MIAMHVSMFTGTVRTHSKLLMTTVVHETKRGMSSSAQLSENAIFVCQVVGVTIEKPFFKYMRAIVNLSFIYRFSGQRRVEHIQFFLYTHFFSSTNQLSLSLNCLSFEGSSSGSMHNLAHLLKQKIYCL